jgi:hypothetical protein
VPSGEVTFIARKAQPGATKLTLPVTDLIKAAYPGKVRQPAICIGETANNHRMTRTAHRKLSPLTPWGEIHSRRRLPCAGASGASKL